MTPDRAFTPTEDAEIVRLREVERSSWPDIAAALEWPEVARVKWRYYSLNHGRPGGTPRLGIDRAERPFTAAEDTLLLRLRDREKLHWPYIATRLEWPDATRCKRRYRTLKVRAEHETPVSIARQGKRRRCMGCGGEFWSQHNGVRRCDECRDKRPAVSPFEPCCGPSLAAERGPADFAR